MKNEKIYVVVLFFLSLCVAIALSYAPEIIAAEDPKDPPATSTPTPTATATLTPTRTPNPNCLPWYHGLYQN